MDIKILVATHKAYQMPKDDIYLPIHVGKEGKTLELGCIGDNTGENISHKNAYYAELTALYWAWKNLNCDYLGLVHYRRHFSVKGRWFRRNHSSIECVLETDKINDLLKIKPVLLPTMRHYYIETIYSQYCHTMTDGEKHLSSTRTIISDKYPDYVLEFDNVMKKRAAYMFNMFVMPKTLANQYCEWLFNILFELEKRVDSRCYSDFDKRYLARVGERLLNVWIVHNKVEAVTIGRIDMWKVNWPKKIAGFLAAKLLGRKQGKSY